MTSNPYAPGNRETLSDIGDAKTPRSATLDSCWRGARKGARIAGYIGGAISLSLVAVALVVTAFAWGSGRGFGVPIFYLFVGIGVLLVFGTLGGILGAMSGLIRQLLRRAGRHAGNPNVVPVTQAASVKPARKSWKRVLSLWPWLAGTLLLLLFVSAFVIGHDIGAHVNRRLAAAIAASDRDDPNWRLDDLLACRERVPDAENSGLIIDRVCAIVPEKWPAAIPSRIDGLVPRETPAEVAFRELDMVPTYIRLSDSAAQALRGELKTYEKAVRLARTVASYRRGSHELVIGPAIVDTLLPHAPQARTVGRLLAADAAIRAHEGDLDGALDSCRAIVMAGRSIGDEPFLISQIVHLAIVEVALKATSRALAQGEASDAALARLQNLILDELDQPLLLIGAKGERATLAEIIRRIRAAEIPVSALTDERRTCRIESPEPVPPWSKLFFDAQQAVGLEWMNEAVAIARRPADKRRPLWKRWEAKIKRMTKDPLGPYTTTLPNLIAPQVSTAASAFSRYQTELGAHAIMLAAERQRRKTGKWPKSIDAIDRSILATTPLDEFSSGPFHLERSDGQLVVYSIGPNGMDEHGMYNPRMWSYGGPDDAGAAAWDVSMRRLTPGPVEE